MKHSVIENSSHLAPKEHTNIFFLNIVNALETEGKNAIDTPLSPAIIIPNSFKLGNLIIIY